jgi:hypothetical protein
VHGGVLGYPGQRAFIYIFSPAAPPPGKELHFLKGTWPKIRKKSLAALAGGDSPPSRGFLWGGDREKWQPQTNRVDPAPVWVNFNQTPSEWPKSLREPTKPASASHRHSCRAARCLPRDSAGNPRNTTFSPPTNGRFLHFGPILGPGRAAGGPGGPISVWGCFASLGRFTAQKWAVSGHFGPLSRPKLAPNGPFSAV